MELKDLKYIRSRSVMVTVHGKEYPIKKHKDKQRWYIQTATGQLTVTELLLKKEYDYNVFFHYYLQGFSVTHPCLVMDWWLEMSTKKRRIPILDFVRPVSFF